MEQKPETDTYSQPTITNNPVSSNKLLVFVLVILLLASIAGGVSAYSWQQSVNDRLAQEINDKNAIISAKAEVKQVDMERITDATSKLSVTYPSGNFTNVYATDDNSSCSLYESHTNLGYKQDDPAVTIRMSSEASYERFKQQTEKQLANPQTDTFCVDAVNAPLDYMTVKNLFASNPTSPTENYADSTHNIAPRTIGKHVWYETDFKDSAGSSKTYTTFVDGKMVVVRIWESKLTGITPEKFIEKLDISSL